MHPQPRNDADRRAMLVASPSNTAEVVVATKIATPTGLSRQERAVFDVLVTETGRVVSRRELARRAGLAELCERRCDALIAGIRKRIGSHRIRTVRRRGWMLVDSTTRSTI